MSVHKELYESDPSGDILPAAHAAAPALVRPRRHLVHLPHIRYAGHPGDRGADVARSASSPLGVPPCRRTLKLGRDFGSYPTRMSMPAFSGKGYMVYFHCLKLFVVFEPFGADGIGQMLYREIGECHVKTIAVRTCSHHAYFNRSIGFHPCVSHHDVFLVVE